MDDLAIARQLIQFARLRKIAVHQFQVLGRLERLVAVRRLVPVGHHVARQRGKHLVRAGFRRNRRHAGERAHRPRNRGCGPILRVRRGRRRALAGQQVDDRQPPGNHCGARCVGRIPEDLQQPGVGLAAGWVAVPFQELRVAGQRGNIVGVVLCGTRQGGTQAGAVARSLRLGPGGSSRQKRQDSQCKYRQQFHTALRLW